MSSHQWRAGTSTWKTASSCGEREALGGDRGVPRSSAWTIPKASQAQLPHQVRPGVDARALAVGGERVRHQDAPSSSRATTCCSARLVSRRRASGSPCGEGLEDPASEGEVVPAIAATHHETLHASAGKEPMGDEVADTTFSRENRQATGTRSSCVWTCSRGCSPSRGSIRTVAHRARDRAQPDRGDRDPALANTHVLELIADDDFQTELAQFNIEINIPPRKLEGAVFSELEETVRRDLNHAEEQAQRARAHMMTIGILPTLTEQLSRRGAEGEPALQAAQRADLRRPRRGPLDQHQRRRAARDLRRHDRARGRVHEGPAAPDDRPAQFGAHWNAAQAIAGIQMAVGANSPFFFGRELWRETRIALFEQTTDTRPEELKAQGVRPRVWFGERWITSIFDLFEENVRYFPSLLPVVEDEDPVAVLEGGGAPRLQELRLHNGTIYRWNRPIYDISRGRPHLRVENRVLPAGPTIVDTLADAAFDDGLIRVLVEDDRPGLVLDVLRRRTRELLRGREAGHRRARRLRGGRRGAGGRARPAPPAADGPRRPRTLGRGRRRRRPPARDHRVLLRAAGQRRLLAGRLGSTISTRTSTAPTPCAR